LAAESSPKRVVSLAELRLGDRGQILARKLWRLQPAVRSADETQVLGDASGYPLASALSSHPFFRPEANQLEAVMVMRRAALLSLAVLLLGFQAWAADNTAPNGFVALFNGKDLDGWKVPAGENGHWKVADRVIDYDTESEASGDKSLWSVREYGDFILQVDWRLKEAPFVNKNVPYILPDGTHARDISGNEMRMTLPDADSGVFLRGDGRFQVNILC
jgi:hypothetical protein